MTMRSKRNVCPAFKEAVPVALNSNDIAYPLLQHLLHRPLKRLAGNIRNDGIRWHDELRMVTTTMVSEMTGNAGRANVLYNK